jgi:hypothetical protein
MENIKGKHLPTSERLLPEMRMLYDTVMNVFKNEGLEPNLEFEPDGKGYIKRVRFHDLSIKSIVEITSEIREYAGIVHCDFTFNVANSTRGEKSWFEIRK